MITSLKLLTCLCCLLITFTYSLGPDHSCQNIRPDLDLNLHSDSILERIFEKSEFWKESADNTKKHAKLPSMQRVNLTYFQIFLQSVSLHMLVLLE